MLVASFPHDWNLQDYRWSKAAHNQGFQHGVQFNREDSDETSTSYHSIYRLCITIAQLRQSIVDQSIVDQSIQSKFASRHVEYHGANSGGDMCSVVSSTCGCQPHSKPNA
jgi:hypothetical protein